jgi:hypothetical protein
VKSHNKSAKGHRRRLDGHWWWWSFCKWDFSNMGHGSFGRQSSEGLGLGLG